MNIMAISFSFDWFLTIPGLLISGGVILLFIALIIFIVTSAKSKRENKEEMEEMTPVTPESDQMVSDTVDINRVVEPIFTGTNTFPVVDEVVMPEAVSLDFIAATPIEPVMEDVVEEVPVAEMPEIVMPSLVAFEPEYAPVVELPVDVVIEPTYLDPIVAPIINETPMYGTYVDASTDTKEEVIPVVEEPVVSIYGGVAPVVVSVKEPEHRQIYGGADPLEATQRMAPILPTSVIPEVMPIVTEATITEPVMADFSTPEVAPVAFVEERVPYTVESPVPDVVFSQPELVQPIPVEVTEKIEEL